MKHFLFFILVFSILLNLSAESFADIFKCPGADGKILYQTEPCKNDEGEKVVESKEYIPKIKNKKTKSKLDDVLQGYEDDLIKLELVDHDFNLTNGEIEFLRSGVKFLYYFYRKFFGYDGALAIKMNMFGNEKEYYDFFSRFSSTPVASGGVYFPRFDEGLINGAKRSRKSAFESTIHESTHAILQKKVKFVPNWINEGMAEYFETLRVSGDSILIPPQNRRYSQLAEYIESGNPVSLKNYFKNTSGPFARAGQIHNQATRTIAWSVVHFLMSSDSGQKSLFRMIKDLRESGGRNSVEIIDKNYTGGIEGLQRKWLKYLRTPSETHYYDKEGLKIFR